MEEALKDERFSHIITDPRFRKMPKNVSKVTVDKRFKGMFKDKKFKEKCMLDKRGRPLNLTPSENLKNLYEVSSELNDDEDEEGSNGNKSKHMPGKAQQQKSYSGATKFREKAAQLNKSSSESESEESSESESEESSERVSDESQDKHIRSEDELDKKIENRKLKQSVNQKNKSMKACSSVQIKEKEESSSDEESDDDSTSESDDDIKGQTEEFDHQWEEHQNEAPDTNEITRRIAVCNMDWDRIRAQDLFVCFNSFKPSDSNILSVKIYPSEFGLKRMEEEKIKGPAELIEETLPLEEVVEDKKGSKYHREKLRRYQMNRLKYYYAVVECDSPETANTLYEQLNGMEYESSSIRFDLRFIPDDVTFDQEPVSTTDKVPDPTGYKPRLFVTTALQQVKVNLTWDETDPRRKELFQRAFTDPDGVEEDIQDYIACSSDDDYYDEKNNEEREEIKLSTNDRISKYRALLKSIEEEEQKKKDEKAKYDIEITWEPGLREKTKEIVKEKVKNKSSNPFEEMLQKKKEERKLKQKEKKAKQKQDEDESSNTSDDDSEGVSNKNVKDSKRLAELALISDSRKVKYTEENSNEKRRNSNQKKKIKAHKLDDFKCNVKDPRFSAIYSSHLYNIDPSDPHFKKTEGNLALIQEKQRKLKSTDFHERNPKSKRVKYS